MQIINKEIKLSLFVNDMTVHIENPKASTQKKHSADY